MMLWIVLVMAGCHPPAQTMDEPYPANRPGVGTLKGTSLGKADGACGELPHYYMQYLDDTQCQKKRRQTSGETTCVPPNSSAPRSSRHRQVTS